MFITLTLICLAATLTGCSLMGLSDYDLKTCASDDDCQVFNEIEGLPSGCQQYYCQDGACLRRPEGQELADGLDNDCDGLIDEPSSDGAQTLVGSGSAAVTSVASEATATFAGDDAGAMSVVWWDGVGGAWFAPLADGESQAEPMTYMRGAHEPGNDNGNDPNLRELELEEGCYRRTATGIVAVACDFSEVAVGLANERVFVAAVNDEGCAAGQLRLGYFDRGATPDVVVRGPFIRSNTYLGVDLNEAGTCSGGGREGCVSGVAPCGAARPAVAALERDPVQALVGWTGDVLARPACGGDAAPVEIIAAHVMLGSFGTEFGWLTGSDEGMPQTLGETAGGGAPALLGLGDAGYLVGYGDADGGLALHAVPAAPSPPEYDGYSCDTPCDFEDRSGQTTAPLTEIVNFDPIAAGSGVDDVAMAPGASADGELELAVAWRSGCDAAGSTIEVVRLVVTMFRGLPTAIADVGEVVVLNAGDTPVGPPALAYLPDGFVTEAFERDGGGAATSDRDGGWVVAWVEAGDSPRLLARRLLEYDGQPLIEDELIDLTVAGSSPSATRAPALSERGGELRFAYHDDESHEIIAGTL